MSEVQIRGATMADETAILEIAQVEMKAQEAMDRSFRLRDDAVGRYRLYLRERGRDMDSVVFVAEMGGEIVGTAIGTVRKQESLFELRRFGYISDLMVKPAARRLGVGRALYDRLVLWFSGLGIDVIRLHVAVRSEEARSFWRSVGARDFLTEAWIDLPRAAGPPDPEAPAQRGRRRAAPDADAEDVSSPAETLE